MVAMLLKQDATDISEFVSPRVIAQSRAEAFLSKHQQQTPVLIVDLESVAEKYYELRSALPQVKIYYAVKANPLPDLIERLAQTDSYFDAASAEEIRLCLAAGISGDRISYGNTIKKADAIAFAHSVGVQMYSADCEAEIRKVAAHAPGSQVCIRLMTSGEGADWPLSRKFGCDSAMVPELFELAKELGLVPYGLSFHVGSQQNDPQQWDAPIAESAAIFADMRMRGITLQLLNLGGGLPASYRGDVPPLEDYASAINNSLDRHFGLVHPKLMIEPGRCLVAEAGIIEAEVVLISRKSHDGPRWVYLDCGKFGGLIETDGETTQYVIQAPGKSALTAPAIIAGPTCDSGDILYEKSGYRLPVDLAEGDRVRIFSAGAYTLSYASIGFNGFAPLHAICI